MKADAEIGGMWPQPGAPGAPRNQEGRRDPPLGPRRECGLLTLWFQASGLQIVREWISVV